MAAIPAHSAVLNPDLRSPAVWPPRPRALIFATFTWSSKVSTATVFDVPLETENPARRLRAVAAAVRVAFTWWGVHKSLTTAQKEEVGDACGADARLMSAGKKIIDVRHPA